MYRQLGLQAVPAKMPVRDGEWKMPALASWAEFQENLIPQATFDRWYGSGGEHANRQNMGILTGRCSGNVFVIDLDDQKGPEAQAWWHGLIELHNNGIDLETVEQRTGGGGRQKLFRAPMDWLAPTNKTAIHIDVRGQGGFAMMPGSMHESGRCYEWMPGCAPWEIEIATAPEWLLEAIDTLIVRHGSRPRIEHTTSPETRKNAFGTKIIEGRESYMRDMIWRVVLDWYRQCPLGPPPAAESTAKMEEAWAVYEDCVGSRLPPEEGVSNADLLERENRGHSLFANKWRRELKNWGSPKMSREAKIRTPSPQSGHSDRVTEVKVDATGQPLPLILTSAEFLAGYTPPAYLIDGVIQRGYLYSLTARTGHGKTAVALYMAQAIARGVDMHGCKVLPGTVLILAGENPDDVRARFFVLGKAYGFDPAASKIRWIAGVKHLPTHMPIIRDEVAKIDDLVLVLVDTAAAYFPGTETNSNSEQGAYARLLRDLTFLKGKPAAIALSHPVKNAARDNLLPMGGSAFLNEVDGNLTLWSANERQTTLHWQGKFRGPEFDPMSFEMVEEHCDTVKDEDGRLLPSVVAKPLSEADVEASEDRAENEEDMLMRAMYGSQAASFSKLANKLGWKKWTVQRLMKRLSEGKFVEQKRNQKYMLTDKGVEAIGGLKKGHHHD
jgi:predicted transcriptional regulator